MNIPEIAKCPNPECGAAMGRLISLQGAWLECSACGYSSPKSDSVEKAIHLHNAICRQPTPEAALPANEIPTLAEMRELFAAHPPKPEPTEEPK